MPNDIIGKILIGALSVWAFSIFEFWLYFMFGVVLSWRSAVALLRRVREVSEETFQYLHRGSINSVFGAVPYISINGSRLNAFVKSDQLNEDSNIKLMKMEWQKNGILVKRNLTICFSLFGVGFIIMVIAVILISSGVLV